jgi:hypothetical protein
MFRPVSPVILSLILSSSLYVDSQTTRACPFCLAGQATLSEDIANSDVAVIARLVDRPPQPANAGPFAAPPCTFEVVEVLKGAHHLAGRPGAMQPYRFEVLYLGEAPLQTTFVAFGNFRPDPDWGRPLELGAAAPEYLRKLPLLLGSGTDRLTFCQNYFEHPDLVLADDAYEEFARAPYSDLLAIRDRMPREKLLRWVGDINIPEHRRKQYLSMLSACGRPEDVPLLENLIRNGDRHVRAALDAQIGAYLVIKGPEGVSLIEDLFLKNVDAEYTDTYSAVMAIRFIGTETKAVARERLNEALRHMLARPNLADLVITDLARWQDWSALPRLVELFKTADPEQVFVRVPVVKYLRACPLPEAKTHLEELAKIDPEAIVRASQYVPQAAVPPEGAQRRASE